MLALSVALLLRWLLEPMLGAHLDFVLLFVAVAITVRFSGPMPAALVTILGLIGAQLLFLQPPAALLPFSATSLLVVGLYFFASGTIIWLGVSSQNLLDKAERSALDLHESERQLLLIIDALPMLVSYIDVSRRYRFNNRAYQLWFGVDRESVRGKHMHDVLGAEAYDVIRPSLERVLSGETVHFESRLAYRYGGSRQVSVTYIPHLQRDRVAGFFAVVEDVGERKQAELVRARLAAIVESTGDAVISKTLKGQITSWNQGAERLFGYSAEEIIGESILRIIPDDLIEEESMILERLSHGERVEHFETERTTRTGERIAVSVSVSPLCDAQGRVVGASKIARDVSEHKRALVALRESESRFRALADDAPILIWMAQPPEQAVWFNRSWLKFTGRNLEQELGQGWLQSVHDEDRESTLVEMKRHIVDGEPFELEYRLCQHDREYRWMLNRGVPMFADDGSVSGYIASCMDITERRRAEQQRVESERRKDEFLATLAHELRNPLAPILNMAQFLRLGTQPDTRELEAVDVIERQTRHMARLVEDLLDLSRINLGKITLRPKTLALADVIASAVEGIRPLAEEAEHHLHIDCAKGLYVDGDLTRLSQVVGNLLSNAVRYTPRGGKIEVVTSGEGDLAVLRVSDSGFGIDSSKLGEIFEMFNLAGMSKAQGHSGLGVGLALSRQLTELHGGEITAFSPGPGKGSVFTVKLPRLVAPRELSDQQQGVAAEADESPSLRILLVDDAPDVVHSMAMLLELAGHEVHVAYDGREAVELAASVQPQLVVLDIGMPELDGYEAAQQIRQLPDGEGIFLVALTGWGQARDRQRAKVAGFDDHYTKPIEFQTVQRILAAASERAEALPAAERSQAGERCG